MKLESTNREWEFKPILQDILSISRYVSELKLEDPFCGALKGERLENRINWRKGRNKNKQNRKERRKEARQTDLALKEEILSNKPIS